jgi:carboxymethylenebutenolidase
MIVINDQYVDLETPSGIMRTHIVRPAAPGRYPGIIFYSEIFQITAPIRRTAAMFAGHGYIVAMPEIYHEYEKPGEVFAYDQAGSDRGNILKTTKPIAGYDADARAVLDHLAARPDCSLGEGMHDDSLERAKDIHGELVMIWGRQDPHVPLDGRMTVLARLNELGTRLSWHEVNGAHAFLRDEGIRYDPELAHSLYGLAFDFFHRKLGEGDLAATAASAESRH